jgi:hypothetical protein
MQRTDTNINNLQFKILKLSQIALYPRGKKRTPVLPYSRTPPESLDSLVLPVYSLDSRSPGSTVGVQGVQEI